ncbi:nuclear transport factor 2 family protein [Legionella worsleiensis]|uniref:SnoaL-like domain protein n=1 Tax=Legionella worsleiensis TaxID=45076 RepID=A0A0W1AKD9_9GAMM|nr:nuclear transport factor 2 family protein [Legionella worsleiensis]KTD81821.1 SnoaL-like domain protein [Legionella worsleiensis]STY31030.1 Predicted ester cyclase [Legionella worsleiensis]
MNIINKLLLTIFFILLSSVCMALSTVEESNKETVLSFYQYALNDKNFSAARPYLGEHYIQHNPLAQDGIDGLRKFIEYLNQTYPYSHNEIKRVFSEGDFVILHVHSIKEPGTRGEAIIDIFRLENNKIVEHWDVHQLVPEKSANENGMF